MYLELHASEYKVTAEGLTVELLPKEFALLQFLYRNRGRTFRREQLLDKVWPLEYPVERTVDDHIYRLRKKLDPFYSVYVRFVQGDLEWLLNTDEVLMSERFYSLFVFYILTGDPKQKLAICERVLEKKLLSPAQHRELEILNILDWYALAGEPDKALERLKLSHTVIAQPDYEYFIPQTAISELFVHLVAGAEEYTLEKMAEAIEARILSIKPFLREIGSYKVVKGLWMLRRKAWHEAEKLLDEGLQVLDRSGFVPMKLYGLYRIIHYCGMFPPEKELQLKYSDFYEEEKERIGLQKLLGPLEATVLNELNRF